MCKSLGEAMAKGKPVVFRGEEKQVPEIVVHAGMEKEALELLDIAGVIKLMRPAGYKEPSPIPRVGAEIYHG